MVSWKKNLTMVWISQLLSISGFSFAMPFAPYYMQELGVGPDNDLKFWVAVFGAAGPLSLAICSPIWGLVADRFGRRLMLLRANFGAAMLLALMGCVSNVETLVALRLLQGILTGTVSAAQTLVSAHTPHNRTGLALGTLSTAVFSGHMAGAFLGGVFADVYGYRLAFILSAGLVFCAGLLVLFGVRENFSKPMQSEIPLAERFRTSRGHVMAVLPILFLITCMAFARQFDHAFLPLLVQEIHGGLKGAGLMSGALSAVCGVAGLISGIVLGRLADRIPPPKIGKLSATGAGILMFLQGAITSFAVLFPVRFGMVFCAGGLDPVFQIWLARVTPESRRGFVFGWAATAKSVGWLAAPLVSGLIAATIGLRSIYVFGGVWFILLVPLIGMVVKRLPSDGKIEMTDDAPDKNRENT